MHQKLIETLYSIHTHFINIKNINLQRNFDKQMKFEIVFTNTRRHNFFMYILYMELCIKYFTMYCVGVLFIIISFYKYIVQHKTHNRREFSAGKLVSRVYDVAMETITSIVYIYKYITYTFS